MFTKNKDNFFQMIDRYGSPRLSHPSELPPIQLQKHTINPLQVLNGSVQAINLYAPKEYRGLYQRLLSELASENKNWEYCDTTMLQFPAHKQIPTRQFKSYMAYYHLHRVVHVFQLEKSEMQSCFSQIIRLANVRHIGTTDLTNRLGKWSIFVKDAITGAELRTIDTIIREFLDEKRKFKQLPYWRTKPLDNLTQGYNNTLQKQYLVKPNAPPPAVPAWEIAHGFNDTK